MGYGERSFNHCIQSSREIATQPPCTNLGPSPEQYQLDELKNNVFDEILGCSGHLTLPEKKWARIIIQVCIEIINQYHSTHFFGKSLGNEFVI